MVVDRFWGGGWVWGPVLKSFGSFDFSGALGVGEGLNCHSQTRISLRSQQGWYASNKVLAGLSNSV